MVRERCQLGEDDNGSIREPMSGPSRAAYGLPVRLTETIAVPGSTLYVDASVAPHDSLLMTIL